MSPNHSIGFCPICGGGLCGIRICSGDGADGEADRARSSPGPTHGLVVCDECEAMWLEPDLGTAHQYPAIEDARCPICSAPLWGPCGRWASRDEIESLGWECAVDPELDATSDEGTS